MAQIKLVILSIFITSCSNISTRNIADLDISEIKATLTFKEEINQPSHHYFQVKLYDEDDKLIGSDSIQVYINTEKLELSGHYRGLGQREIYYGLRGFKKASSYQVSIALSDEPTKIIGNIQPKPSNLRTNFSFPETLFLHKDYVIKCDSLDTNTQLSFELSLRDSLDSRKGSGARKDLRYTDFKNKTYTLKKETYRDSTNVLNIISCELTHTQKGNISSQLLEGSSFKYNTVLDKYINIEK